MDTYRSIHLWCFSWYYIVYNAMDNGNDSHYNIRLIMMEREVLGSKLWVINFYQEQLNKFAKLGLGKLTEFDVKVTEELISTTQRRLNEITTIYDGNLDPRTHMLRRARRRLANREKLRNGSTNSNGTTAAQSRKDNSNIGHEGSKS